VSQSELLNWMQKNYREVAWADAVKCAKAPSRSEFL
jgi:hypothetical protein